MTSNESVPGNDQWRRQARPLVIVILLFGMLLVACASAPQRTDLLEDRSADTDYELESVLGRLQEAENWEARGNRELASAIYDTALEILPAESQRERDYLRCLQAALWGRYGEGRDEQRARDLLRQASRGEELPAQDARLTADVLLALAVIECGAGDYNKAEANAEQAFECLASIDAFDLIVDSRLGLAESFNACGEHERSHGQARIALQLARRLSDYTLVQAGLGAAGLLPQTERAIALRDAYEACFRLSDDALRAVVIATAVQAYFNEEDWAACVRWGDRLRDRDTGAMPEPESSGLYEEDYIEMRSRYALAASHAGDHRSARLLPEAIALIDTRAADVRSQFALWREKLEGALLQLNGD